MTPERGNRDGLDEAKPSQECIRSALNFLWPNSVGTIMEFKYLSRSEKESCLRLAVLLEHFREVGTLERHSQAERGKDSALLQAIRELPRYGPEYEYDTGLQMVQYKGAECVYLSDVEKLFANAPDPSAIRAAALEEAAQLAYEMQRKEGRSEIGNAIRALAGAATRPAEGGQ